MVCQKNLHNTKEGNKGETEEQKRYKTIFKKGKNKPYLTNFSYMKK